MTKSKNTKRALLMSVLSMMLCMAMLVGSTFAWFTDTVTSGKNRIVAGNLDVELEYSIDGKTWTTVDKNTNMFKDGALWEPGYTEVVYLQVKNVGSLALKYRLGINVAEKVIGKTADDKDIDLANFIKFGVVEANAAFADRSEARNAVKDTAALISAGYSSDDRHLTKESTSKMLALVVYMPEEVGNDANHGTGKRAPEIYMGINLVATQDTVESDSFGTDYDKNAEYPDPSAWDGKASNTDWYDEEETSFTISTPEDLAGLAELVNTGTNFKNKTITLGSDINLAGEEWAPIGSGVSTAFDGTFDGNDHTISNVEVNSNSSYAGFFGVLGPDARVENLTLNNVSVVSLGNGVGAVAGYGNINWSPVAIPTIENVQLTGTLTVEGNLWVGGIVGYQHANVIGCTIDAEAGSTVTGADYVGGLVGQSEGISGITKYISKNTLKNVTIVGTDYVGGIMGVAQINNEITDNTLENVTVNATENASGIGALVGRVYLYIGGDWPTKLTLKFDGNSGTVAVNNAAQSDVCDGLVGVTESDRPANATFIFDGVNNVTATWN